MTNGVGISTYVVDKTKPGLLSALNNTTKITSDIAKKLALEVNVKFPSIADQTKDLKKQWSAARRSMGNINFVGERLGKKGNGLGLLGFDGEALRSDMSLDAVKRHLARLKEIQAKLDDNTLVSASVGEAFKKEQKDIVNAVRALEQYKNTLELVIRTNKKFQTKLTSEASYEQVNSQRRYKSQRHWIDEKVVNQDMDAEKKRREAERKAAIKSHEDIVKENEKEFAARIKRQRYAANIDDAIENERIARQKWLDRNQKTNSNRNEKNIRREIKALEDLRRAEDALDKAQGKRKRNNRKSSDTNQRIQLLKKEAEAIRDSADATKELDKQNSVFGKLTKLAARYFSVHQIIQFGQKIAETTGYFQQQQVALEGILQSATEAKRVLNDITDFALKSPFQTNELVGFTKQLSAFGIGSKDLFPTVTKLADISAGLGVDMSRIILAYGQVKSAAVLRGQELRQFTEAGIPMVDALAKKFTALNGELVTTADVFDLISKRQVSFEMVASVLSDMASEGGRFYMMQENITNTMYGQIQKLKDLWTLALNDMGKSSTSILNKVIKFLQHVVKNAKTVSFAIATAFVVSPLVYFGRQLLMLRGNLEATRAQINKIKLSLSALKGSLISIGAGLAVGAIFGWITKVIDESKKLKNAFREIEDSFDRENAKMISGLEELSKKISSLSIGSKEFNEAVGTLASNYGDFVDDDIIEALQAQGDAAQKTAEKFGEIASSVRDAILAYQEYKELREKRESVKDEFIRVKTEKPFIPDHTTLSWEDDKAIFNKLTTLLGRQANWEDRDKYIDSLFDKAVREFANSNIISEGNFRTIFYKLLQNAFPDVKDFTSIVDLGWSRVNEREGLFAPDYLQELQDAIALVNSNDYDVITKAFQNVDLSDVVGDALEKYYKTDNAYRKMLLKTPSNEKDRTIQSVISDVVSLENTERTRKAFEELNATLGDDTKTVRDVAKAFELLIDSITDDERRRKIVEISNLYKSQSDLLNEDEDALAERLNSIKDFEGKSVKVNGEDRSIQDYFEQWNPAIRGEKTIKQTQEEIASTYEELIKDRRRYATDKNKDGLYNDDIELIDKKLEVLRKISEPYYYNVNLSTLDSNQLSTELTDFISEIKNAYTRYKEAVQKGGIGMGLNYVRNDVEFTEMFGEFFHGANSEMFKKLSEVMIGDTNAGELLKGKFLTKMEDGVLDFESAITSVAVELEKYAKGDEKNRKQYAQAAKQLRQWINTTFSKDDLSIALKELEKQVKSLTNSFERSKTQIDLTRDLQKNGTLNMFAKSLASKDTLGIQAKDARETKIAEELQARKEQALRPDSKILEDFLLDTVEKINGKLPTGAASFSFKGKDLSRIDDLYAAIDEIGGITEMNNKNIPGTQFGPFGKEIIKILKELIKVRSEEMKSISGKIFTGDEMYDSLMNSVKMINQEIETNTKHQNTAAIDGLIDSGAYEKIVKMTQDQAKEFIDLYMKDNRLDVLADGSKWMLKKDGINKLRENINDGYVNVRGEKIDIPEILKKELLHKLDDLEINIDNYNANIGAFGSFSRAVKNYRNAGKTAYDKWEAESKNHDSIIGQLNSGKDLKGNNLSPEQIVTLNSQLMTSRERLKEMGHEGQKLKQDIENISLDQMNKSMQATQQNFSNLVNAVETIVSSMKDFAAAVHKAYDVMNDGENPEWMQEVEDSLGDFGEMFSALITPVMSIISLIATLTIAFVSCEAAMVPMLIAMAVVIALAAIVAGVVAAAQAHDRALQRSIEDLEKEIEDTQTAMKNLDAAAERMVGINKYKKQMESLSKNMEMYHDALEQARLEEEKKNTDQDKVDEYKQNAQEYLDTFKNGLKEMFEEITGSVDEFADAISSAMRSAFQSGENAARNMAAVVKENIGNIIEEIMKMNYLKPAIETAMNTLWGGNIDDITKDFYDDETGEYDYKKALDYFLKRLNNEENVENFEESMNAISTGYIDLYNSLSDTMKEYFSFSSDNSALSGGISGITEDTARTLEGLANSMLMQMILTNRELSTISQSGFAQVQVSWFNDMLQQARATRVATENLNNAIAEMRNGVRPMSVTIS